MENSAKFSKYNNLHDAVRFGCEQSVRALLEQKHDVNGLDSSGNTPLLLAVCIKEEITYNNIIEILILNGANVNAFNKGITALFNAAFYQRKTSVEMLLQAGARPDGKTVHFLAENGCLEILKLVLADDKTCLLQDIMDCCDDFGRTPAYKAAQNNHQTCLRMLIEQGANLSRVTIENETVMDVIFEETTEPVNFILQMLDSSVFSRKIKERHSYFVDFGLLVPKKSKRQMDVISSLLVAASNEEKTEVLQHPVIELFLILKWAKICHFFFFWIAIYIIFAVSMSIYVTLLIQKDQQFGPLQTTARWILLLTAAGLLAHALLQCGLTHGNYFQKYEMWMNVACTLLSLTAAICADQINATNRNEKMPNWVLHITSIAVLLAWSELMLLIGRLPAFGYYALMFSTVLQNVIRVLLAFVCLLVGFSFSFSIQFANIDQFSNPWKALVKTSVMMMGEFEYSDLFIDDNTNHLSSRLVFLIFIVLTSIVLMNLMVGLAVSDIQTLQKESHARKLEKQADFLAQLEKVISSKQLNSKYMPKCLRKFFAKNSFIDTVYELETCAKFRRSKTLPSGLIDSLLAIAKINRNR